MGAAVPERIAVIRIDAERLDPPGIDEVGDCADQALPLIFLFVAATGREHDHRRAPVAEDDGPHVAADATGMPTVHFTSHRSRSHYTC